MRAVRFEEYGDESVLQVVEVPDPMPGPGEVVVRVVTAGVNPGEAMVREGVFAESYPAEFPEGQGSDLAGQIVAIGDGVEDLAVGQEVIGMSDLRNAHAELALLPATHVVPKPMALRWDTAATLYVAGSTALALLQAVPVAPADVVVITGAAGGVGVFLTQLAVGTAATVIAVAGEAHHDWLRAHGAIPVAYGDGLETRIRAAAPRDVTAFFDLFGSGYAELGVALGVPRHRVVTIADPGAAERIGVEVTGMSSLRNPRYAVRALAEIASEGGFDVPIKGRYPLDEVQEAYRAVSRRKGLGKVVLEVQRP